MTPGDPLDKRKARPMLEPSPSPFGKSQLTAYLGERARTFVAHQPPCDGDGWGCVGGPFGCRWEIEPSTRYVAPMTTFVFLRQRIYPEVHRCFVCGASEACTAAWVEEGSRKVCFLCTHCDSSARHSLAPWDR